MGTSFMDWWRRIKARWNHDPFVDPPDPLLRRMWWAWEVLTGTAHAYPATLVAELEEAEEAEAEHARMYGHDPFDDPAVRDELTRMEAELDHLRHGGDLHWR